MYSMCVVPPFIKWMPWQLGEYFENKLYWNRWWTHYQKKGDLSRARLVAQGYEEPEPIQKDSPTVGRDGFCTFLFIVFNHQWQVKTTDIKSAFLQGQPLERDVYIDQPKEAKVKEGIIWHLNTCFYGLNDAVRQFYLSVKESLFKLTCFQVTLDPAIFFYHQHNKHCCVLACHVDDFFHAGNAQFEDNIKAPLRSRFLAGKLVETIFK